MEIIRVRGLPVLTSTRRTVPTGGKLGWSARCHGDLLGAVRRARQGAEPTLTPMAGAALPVPPVSVGVEPPPVDWPAEVGGLSPPPPGPGLPPPPPGPPLPPLPVV